MQRAAFEKLFLATLCLVCWFGGAVCFAQSNPFQESDPTARAEQSDVDQNQPAELPEFDESLPVGNKLIIRSVLESNPQTAAEFGNAVKLMVDIESFDYARYFLAKLDESMTSEAEIFKVFELLGSDFFLQLHGADQLQPLGRELARRVLAVSKKQAESPARIDQLIKTLSSPDVSVRSTAFRQLRRLGEPAVVEMIHVFASPERKSEFVGVRSALKSMGQSAKQPLLGAARASNLQVQAEAVRALRKFPSAEATDVMMRTYLSPKLPESLRRVALDSLQQSNRLPANPASVEERFYQRAKEYLMGHNRLAGGLMGDRKLYQWNTSTNRLESFLVSSATASRLAAAERAADLYEISPSSDRNRKLYLITQLEAAKRVAGSNRSVDVKSLLNKFPNANASEIDQILGDAIRLKLIPASIACCEILSEIGSPELVMGMASSQRPLVKALLLGDRHLQYAAFEAISKIDPQQAYVGSSYAMLMAVYLASSETRAAGLVGHVREDIGQSYAATLQSAGLFGKSVRSSRDFFRQAVRDPDLDVLLITDTMDRPDYAELVQQLRNDLRTKRTPIVLLYRDSRASSRAQRMAGSDAFFVALPLTLEPELVASQVKRAKELSQPWAVNDLDRRKHAYTAMNWLAKIAKQRDVYRFYNLGNHQQELTRLLYKPGFAESASEILINLGTPTAQRELLNFASQSGMPIESREKVADAFYRAVQNGGTLLTKQEVLRQYDRYNASANESPATQKVLGSILDAIESRAKSD